MKILFWQQNIINEPGIERAFRAMNIELIIHKNILDDWDYDKTCLETLSNYLQTSSFHCVFTVNYVPIISRVCDIYKVPYLSWIVDSPCFHFIPKQYQIP